MARIAMSPDELRMAASRLGMRAEELRSVLEHVHSDLGILADDWTGGRAAPLLEALAAVERSRAELLRALDAASSYIRATSDLYQNTGGAPAFGAPIVPRHPPERSERLTLVQAMGLKELNTNEIVARWRSPATSRGFTVGYQDDGEPVDVGLDSGHVLIGGMTGSGKTELIRSIVMSLALSYSPQLLGLVLVDFKGGGAFGELDQLPHTVATVSALDDGYTTRWLTQLDAELERRSHGQRVPEHLFVAVDEVGELFDQQSDLVHGSLRRLARVGRGLGVHFVIASQRAKSVPAWLRESADVRVALRVTSRAESVELVGVAGAEALPPHGKIGYVATGKEPPRRFSLTAPVTPASVLQTIKEVNAMVGGSNRGVRRWPPPLPVLVHLDDLPIQEVGAIPLGLVDYPDLLEQRAVSWQPREDGNLLITGPPASGKTSALAVIGEAARLAGYETLPEGSSEVYRMRRLADSDGLSPLVRHIRAHADRARGRTVVLLDGLDEVGGREDQQALLDKLMRSAVTGRPSSGVYFAVSSRPDPSPRAGLRDRFGTVIDLAPWEDQMSRAVTSRARGRGLWNGLEIQLPTPRFLLAPDSTT